MTKKERIPPYSEEAEQCLLGAVLIEYAKVMDIAIESGLSETDFYVPANRLVFAAFTTLHQSSRPIDCFTTAQYMRDSGQLDGIGGQAYLERLFDETPTAALRVLHLRDTPKGKTTSRHRSLPRNRTSCLLMRRGRSRGSAIKGRVSLSRDPRQIWSG